jgi:hypothetical protein
MFPAWVFEGFEKRLTHPGGMSMVAFFLCRGSHGSTIITKGIFWGTEIPTRTILNAECSLSLINWVRVGEKAGKITPKPLPRDVLLCGWLNGL